jgi:putative DNA primase/helicase
MESPLKPRSSFNLDQWIADNPQIHYKAPEKKQPLLPSYNPNHARDAYSQARTYIAKVGPAIQGQGGWRYTFGVCGYLIKGFALTLIEAKSLLSIWNNSCVPPWSNEELDQLLIKADKAPDFEPRGFKLDKNKNKFENIDFNDNENVDLTQIPDEQIKYDHSGIIDDPASLTVKFIEDNKTESGLCAYRWWYSQFYKWNGTHYDPLIKEEFNSIISTYAEKQFLKQYNLECSQVPDGDISKVKKKKVTTNLVEHIKVCIINKIAIPKTNTSEPFWVSTPGNNWNPDDIIPSKNKLIHLPSFVNNISPAIIPKNPRYFSTYSLGYDFPYSRYDGPVDPPPVFRYALDSIWPGDQDSIDCLQEFFGYFLTPCTSLQKILMLIGQKRSGKGTIIRILKHMLGFENVCFPTFKSLTSTFGKQSLIGKTLAVFPDARITGRTDTGDVVETLLAISGEDSQTIERKHISSITTKLNTRFVIASNELPRLTENSGAIASRFIVLRFNETFLENEDTELEQKLIPEIPAILRWSIDGWIRLYDRKKFVQPPSGIQTMSDFLHISSPINHFITDAVDLGNVHSSTVKKLFNAWKTWCEWQNKENIGDIDNFTRNLQAAIPKLEFGKEPIPHNGDSMAWDRLVNGIRIKDIKNGYHDDSYSMDEESTRNYAREMDKMREGMS